MKEVNEETILKYDKMIRIVVSKYDRSVREDLRQDLYLYLVEGMKKDWFVNSDDMDSYIFISLKNRASYEFKTKYQNNIKTISLNMRDSKTGNEWIDSIPDNGDEGANEVNASNMLMEELKERICEICQESDYVLLYRYIVDKTSQKELAQELKITQQAVSKKLKKIIQTIRENLNIQIL